MVWLVGTFWNPVKELKSCQVSIIDTTMMRIHATGDLKNFCKGAPLGEVGIQQTAAYQRAATAPCG